MCYKTIHLYALDVLLSEFLCMQVFLEITDDWRQMGNFTAEPRFEIHKFGKF